MNITVRFFGAFGRFGRQVELSMADDAVVADLGAALSEKLKGRPADIDVAALIRASRFATDAEILPDSAPLEGLAWIAIIPPVSGG